MRMRAIAHFETFACPHITLHHALSRFITTRCYTRRVPTDTPRFTAAPLPDFYVTPNRKALHEHLVTQADLDGRVLTTTVALGEELGLTTSVVQHTLGYLVQIGLATYVPGGRSRLAVITLTPSEEVA